MSNDLTQRQDRVYAKGGFVPRPKGQRYMHLYDLFPLFANQQGQVHDVNLELPGVQSITKVEFLGRFQAPDHYPGVISWYRAFKVTLASGMVVAAYSRDADQYVICIHVGYSPQRA